MYTPAYTNQSSKKAPTTYIARFQRAMHRTVIKISAIPINKLGYKVIKPIESENNFEPKGKVSSQARNRIPIIFLLFAFAGFISSWFSRGRLVKVDAFGPVNNTTRGSQHSYMNG